MQKLNPDPFSQNLLIDFLCSLLYLDHIYIHFHVNVFFVLKILHMNVCHKTDIVVNYYWGSSNIFNHIGQGEIFAETYATIPNKEMLCDVVAAEKTEVLFINVEKVLSVCENQCSFHNRLLRNLLKNSAQKNISLATRMMHTASKFIRDRLLSYFSEQAILNGGNTFTVPFSRQQLADYLGVDRSAMSNELSKMKHDGLIDYQKNDFILINNDF